MIRQKKLEFFILVVTNVVIEIQAIKQSVKDPKFYVALYGPVLSGPKLIEMANELVRMEQYEFALELFDKVIEKNPNEISYYDHRAVCYSLMGPEYLDMAWSEFKKTVGSGKESSVLDASAFENLAIKLYESQNYTKAKWCYSEAIKSSRVENEESPNGSLYLMRGICNLMTEDLEAANMDLKEAATLLSQVAGIEEQKRLQEALHNFGRWEEAVQYSLTILDDTELDGLGKKFKESKKFEEAAHCYDEAIKRDPENMDFYQKRAECYMGMNNLDLAVQDFKTRLNKNIHDTGYWHSLIEALFSVGKFQEALNETETLEEIELRWLARKFMMSEKYVDALRLYDEGVRKYASEAGSYTARAECHRRMKNYNEEIRDLRRAVNLDSALRDSLFVEKLIWYGMFEMALQEAKFLEEPQQLFEAGSGFFRNDKFNEAVHCYTEAILKDPTKYNFYYQRGLSYFKLNEFKQAITDFKESLKKAPGELSPRVYLTEALIEVNESDEAEKVFQKVVSMSKIPADSSHHWYYVRRKVKNSRPRGPPREIRRAASGNDVRSMRDTEQLQALLLQVSVR